MKQQHNSRIFATSQAVGRAFFILPNISLLLVLLVLIIIEHVVSVA